MGLNLQGRYCEWCQGIYQPKRKGQRFCRPKCRAAWHRSEAAFSRFKAFGEPDDDTTLAHSPPICPHCGRKDVIFALVKP